MARSYAVALGLLALAFSLRVLGQAVVAFLGVDFLPPMAEWSSGLVTYPVLLPIQLAILAVQVKISVDIGRGRGFFTERRPRTGRLLCGLSFVYFTGMLVRYCLTMWLLPERRWFGGTIPIAFHWVLAAYIFVIGKYYQSTNK